MSIPFVREFDFRYGEADRLSPLVTRVIAENPGPFTFTGTATYIVGDARGVALIDPGPNDPRHAEAVLAALPGPVRAILVTHTHGDHSGGTGALRQATGAPVLAFGPHPPLPEGAAAGLEEGADRDFEPDERLMDGQRVALPACGLDAVHTPGHLPNHLCFAMAEEAALFCGDQVMGWATTVVAPPEGDMAAYLDSLDRLAARRDAIYYPTHGAPITDPLPFVEAVKAHRSARDAAIMAALEAGPAAPEEIVERVYDDLDPRLVFAAALNVKAHLLMRERDGSVRREGDTYALA